MSDVTPEVEPKELADLLAKWPGQDKASADVRAGMRAGFWRGLEAGRKLETHRLERQLKEVKS